MYRFAVILGLILQITTVIPGPRPTKNMLFVVDVSASMQSAELHSAINAVRMIGGQAIDDGAFGVIAFSTGHTVRWKYKKKKWAKLPDGKALRAAYKWISLNTTLNSTSISKALEMALKDPKKKLTIIIISDGIIQDWRKACKVIKKYQKKRKKKAMIMCFNIRNPGPLAKHSPMAQFAKLGGGGYYY